MASRKASSSYESDADSLLITRQTVTLRQRACDKLRQAIIDHRLPPGSKLVERDLCQQLGVSRPSLREALRHLESEKLIKMVPHKGSVVATLEPEEVREIYEVRAALEGMACEKFAERASDRDIERLKETFAKLEQAIEREDDRDVLQAKAEFYDTIFSGGGCTITQGLVSSLVVRIEMLRRMSLASKGRYAVMLPEIRPILDAAVVRDGQAMKASCIAHIENAMSAALSQMRGAAGEPAAIGSNEKNTTPSTQ